ncbi:hypothetical protein K435DRAFT_785438 [Dendrothele bispora CBS 962.96]|uniref:Ubiquitin-like domain-containing protein n=1 Tax=Dendrothele bispora (strain CBS 962.96) TaxID=1314807 RepID=A0A4S8KWZ4_DENBC|nr:hypothetical protein K435DRAFT_785438 [Dendrothele bispora CBS 962.96]
MTEQAEIAFIKTFSNTIASQPVSYPDNYQQPSANSLKRVPVLPVSVPIPPTSHRSSTPSPDAADAGASSSTSAKISLTIKSTKPAVTYTVDGVHPSDSILALKEMVREKYKDGDGINLPSAPPLDAMRLLLKGKALGDQKLLKEYNVKDGDTINLMVKSGVDWDPAKPVSKSAEIRSPKPVAAGETSAASNMLGTETGTGSKRKHQRIPSVVLSPSPSNDSPEAEGQPRPDIMLELDSIDTSAPEMKEVSTYHTVISSPGFWDRLHSFLRTEFTTDADILTAFEDFLRASKGNLTASEIAKIRDQVGVVGMGGT